MSSDNIHREPNSGHGHVFPRPDGVKARCGGPALCGECSGDLAQKVMPPSLAPLRTQEEAAMNALPKALENNEKLRRALLTILGLPSGSQGAYSKFKQAQDIAHEALKL